MAYVFNPYRTLPTNSRTNPYFISTSRGGKSHCIVRGSGGYTLPNCVALVHAEWLQILASAVGETAAEAYESKLCRNNASVYFGYTSDGFKRGQLPKLGAIACWSGGKSGAGHVAFVTAFNGRDWSGVASNYSGSAFYNCSYRHSASYGYYLGSTYKWQGFIYPPVEFSEYATTPVARSSKTAQIRVNIDNLNVRDKASTSGARLGFAAPGYYNVLSQKSDNTYTWYEIERGKWVANPTKNGEWVTYYPEEKPAMYDVTFRVSAGDVAGLVEYGEKVIQVKPTVTKVQ